MRGKTVAQRMRVHIFRECGPPGSSFTSMVDHLGSNGAIAGLTSRAMKPIFEKLEALEITPAGKTREIQEGPSTHEAIDHVIRRAEELRKTWSKTNGVGARSSALASAAAKV
ncbi:MAG: hypothetical protein WCE26_24955 [Candidatus Acidiferrales bacterium]